MPPDPGRLGGLEWTRRTNGELSSRERRRLLGGIVRGQASYVADRVKLATGRVPKAAQSIAFADLRPPDSALAREAEAAALEQSDEVAGHGRRTWAWGLALATLDQVELDPEQFYVASLLHDHGLDHPRAGEDFTIRSAARAIDCVEATGGDAATGAAIGDAITIHCTPGISIETDGAEGFYVMSGALLDLAGSRACDLTRAFRETTLEQYPRGGLTARITQLIAEEAKLNPRGRFALLKGCGFPLLIRMAPLKPR